MKNVMIVFGTRPKVKNVEKKQVMETQLTMKKERISKLGIKLFNQLIEK